MSPAQLLDAAAVLLVERLELDHLGVEPPRQHAERVVHKGDAPRHPGREVAARRAQDEDGAAGHVLTGVVPHPFHDRDRPGVADTEALAHLAPDEGRARRRPVEHDVAGDDLLLSPKRGGLGGTHDEDPAREALAEVVVGVAGESHRHAPGQKGPEALPGRAAK